MSSDGYSPDLFNNLIADFTGDSLVVISPQKKVIYTNLAARQLLQLEEQEDYSSVHCCEVLNMDLCLSDCPAEKIRTQRDVINSYFVRRKNSKKVFCVTTSLICGEGGERLGHIHSIKNMEMVNQLIQEQSMTQEKLRRSQLQMSAILESIANGVFTVDRNGKIIHFSRSMECITGFAEKDILGKTCKEVLRGGLCGAECPIEGSLQDDERVERAHEHIHDSSGRVVPVSISTSLIREDGETTGVVCSVHDRSEIEKLKQELLEKARMPEIVGKSKKMLTLYDLIESVCNTDITVLVEGETGTGKELVSRAIHRRSSRRDGPFVTVNCSVLSPFLLESELFGHARGSFTGAVRDRQGKFEIADGGTIFLDEISEIGKDIQVKLLRFLETKEFERVGESTPRKVDARIIAATNRHLKDMTAKGGFRRDLFYRLNVVPVTVPPLRARKEDIPLLVEHFIQKHGRLSSTVEGISTQALRKVVNYHWPGNVRELENAIVYALASCIGKRIEKKDLPPDVLEVFRDRRAHSSTASSADDPSDLEKKRIIKALEKRKWRVGKAAEELGYHRTTLWRRIKHLNIILPNRGH